LFFNNLLQTEGTAMNVQPRLLDHPFYQAWTKGEVTREQLAVYHRSYAEFIRRMPDYWQRVVDAYGKDTTLGHDVVQDEREHIALWERWGKDLTPPETYPDMQEVIRALDAMTPSQLLGALQAFEMQQPEVARTKKEGLIKFYGCREGDLTYFDEHQMEEGHISYGRWLAENFADQAEYRDGFKRGAELVYRSLDNFIPARN
jgi:pyrroloquinoline-quinone synthase